MSGIIAGALWIALVIAACIFFSWVERRRSRGDEQAAETIEISPKSLAALKMVPLPAPPYDSPEDYVI